MTETLLCWLPYCTVIMGPRGTKTWRNFQIFFSSFPGSTISFLCPRSRIKIRKN